MAILTPNAVYAFPSIDYLANQYGHTLILLGISVAMIVFNERPYAKDIFIIFGFTTLILDSLVSDQLSSRSPSQLLVSFRKALWR